MTTHFVKNQDKLGVTKEGPNKGKMAEELVYMDPLCNPECENDKIKSG